MDDTARNDFPDWIVLPEKASSYYLTSSGSIHWPPSSDI